MYFAFKGHIYYIKPLQRKRKNKKEESMAGGEKMKSCCNLKDEHV
jgi:hypothetical protein